ncbi:hypothetical protein AB29_0977 [Escherichia coli 2-177-06_S1_C2]|nr:hypothetical protein AB29_0977 [Escherichia coli 2-177-06_S1_C2]
MVCICVAEAASDTGAVGKVMQAVTGTDVTAARDSAIATPVRFPRERASSEATTRVPVM